MKHGAAEVWTVCKHGRSYQHISGENQWIEEMHEHKQVREQAMKIYSKAAEPQMSFCNFPVINTWRTKFCHNLRGLQTPGNA